MVENTQRHTGIDKHPWMTKGLINACNKKNNLYKKFIKNRNEINEQRYKKNKNKLISVLRMSKQEYYTKILNKHKKNIKETGNILRNVTGSSTANTFPNSFVTNNKLISNKNDIVNGLNNFLTILVLTLQRTSLILQTNILLITLELV